jgi:hypothetical protein
MKASRTHFAYRLDRWDATGDSILEHVAGVEDLLLAKLHVSAGLAAPIWALLHWLNFKNSARPS